jgi:carbamoyltransferase
MKVIGFSGLDNSSAFKRSKFPELESRAYRIAQGFDSAAALVVDGEIVAAAAEERFTRDKATGSFPVRSIRYCLEEGGLDISQVDYFAHGFAYEPYQKYFQADDYSRDQFEAIYRKQVQEKLLQQQLGIQNAASRLVCVQHHLAHAASAFFPSGFSDALILITDGMGEVESMTVLSADGTKMKVLQTVPAAHSIGSLYGVFTLYFGFKFNMDEYKVMGLAPHGNPDRYIDKMRSLVKLKSGGAYAIPILQRNNTQQERETYSGTLQAITEMFGPPAARGTELEQHHVDMAAALQRVLQECTFHTLQHFAKETGHRNLCMAGGVALNCTGNGLIQRSGLFKEMFIQPAAGDDGTALGAALYVQHVHPGGVVPRKMNMPLWGPAFSDEQIQAQIEIPPGFRERRFSRFDDLIEESAKKLSEGQACAWFQDRMEFGPRALGNRSILADPRPATMRERINRIIKKREGFRPFAPAVTAEAARKYFVIEEGKEDTFAHMLYVTSVHPEFREALPAITHIDGSARVQTVSRDNNEQFWRLLNAFEAFSGFPILLNTSFNVQEPIVCTPKEALATFVDTNLDFLVLGKNLLIEREK